MRLETLVALEDALAAELRISQAIAALAERERLALQRDDLTALAEVVREKEIRLAELNRHEAARNAAAEALASEAQVSSEAVAAFEQILSKLDKPAALQLSMLRDGVRAHLEHARSLSAGNRALVQAALDRNSAVRNFLLRLASGGDNYSPAGAKQPRGPAGHWMDLSG